MLRGHSRIDVHQGNFNFWLFTEKQKFDSIQTLKNIRIDSSMSAPLHHCSILTRINYF